MGGNQIKSSFLSTLSKIYGGSLDFIQKINSFSYKNKLQLENFIYSQSILTK